MLLFICFATLIKSTPILRRIFLSEKKGFWGTFYKGARLPFPINTTTISSSSFASSAF
jgi:hypothetical protein